MTLKEMKTAKNNEIIYEYVRNFARFCVNLNTGSGTKNISKTLTALETEILNRELLTPEQIKSLQS